MKHTYRVNPRRQALWVLGALITGCSGAADGGGATGPGASQAKPVTLYMSARPLPVETCTPPGTIVSPGPTVVVIDGDRTPQPNVVVSFAVTGGGGALENATAVTDNAGVATAGRWRLGASLGSNTAVATAARGPAEMFAVTTARSAKVVAVFEQTPAYGLEGNGGHYYLAADSTYDFGYDFNAPPSVPGMVCSSAHYEVDSLNRIRFFLAPGSYPASQFYAERNGLFATGTLSGNRMAVHYEDPVDFDNELYELVGTSAAARWP